MDKEILWNIINSMLAGILVFLGALTTGNITKESIGISIVTALIVAVTKFRDYWSKEEGEYTNKPCKAFSNAFNFI